MVDRGWAVTPAAFRTGRSQPPSPLLRDIILSCPTQPHPPLRPYLPPPAIFLNPLDSEASTCLILRISSLGLSSLVLYLEFLVCAHTARATLVLLDL